MLAKINIDNYQIYILDFYEGNLSEELQAELFEFLQRHPNLKEEFESFESVQLEMVEEKFDRKTQLLKSEDDLFKKDSTIISYLEGDMSLNEQHSFANRLSNDPELNRAVELYRSTYLKAPSIVFPWKKELLKKQTKIIYFQYWKYAAAVAVFLFFAGVYYNSFHKSKTELATNNPTIQDSGIEIVPEKWKAPSVQSNESKGKENIEVMVHEKHILADNVKNEELSPGGSKQLDVDSVQFQLKHEKQELLEQNNSSIATTEPLHHNVVEENIASEVLADLSDMDLSQEEINKPNGLTETIHALTNNSVYVEPGSASKHRKRAFKIDVGPLDIARNDHAIGNR